MAQHTPGPWTVDETDVRDEAQKVLDQFGCEVADAFCAQRPGECEANARLIAAAPALLRIAKRLAHAASMDPGQDRLAAFQIVADEARSVIAKADA